MAELGVWYDQDSSDAYQEGDPVIPVRTAGELDALIDRVRAETVSHRCPAMIQVGLLGNEGYPVLEVGLGQDKGFIHYNAQDARRTIGDGDPNANVEYVYMGSLGEVPADSEVSIDVVRQGLHEFLATGTRLSVVRED
ncbi:Imm1 family immunity protein [Actinokineospora pegani]|uniref:Imm1 family immunity protein n=1 Tax=Actinokineospora pegani TaxID=2654637 RepID=UPI0012EAD4E5|nr:Imm1 family immunity protein [Actinokineospora pegani]